jgi:hypothetical protein
MSQTDDIQAMEASDTVPTTRCEKCGTYHDNWTFLGNVKDREGDVLYGEYRCNGCRAYIRVFND